MCARRIHRASAVLRPCRSVRRANRVAGNRDSRHSLAHLRRSSVRVHPTRAGRAPPGMDASRLCTCTRHRQHSGDRCRTGRRLGARGYSPSNRARDRPLGRVGDDRWRRGAMDCAHARACRSSHDGDQPGLTPGTEASGTRRLRIMSHGSTMLNVGDGLSNKAKKRTRSMRLPLIDTSLPKRRSFAPA